MEQTLTMKNGLLLCGSLLLIFAFLLPLCCDFVQLLLLLLPGKIKTGLQAKVANKQTNKPLRRNWADLRGFRHVFLVLVFSPRSQKAVDLGSVTSLHLLPLLCLFRARLEDSLS